MKFVNNILYFLRNSPCTPAQLFEFTWTLFVSSKSEIPDILDDLVNSYHLLLVCCNFIYANSILANRDDLLNPQFMGKFTQVIF